MLTIDASHVQRLIQIESQVHYGELPPPGCDPYVCVLRNSHIVLSAPHGARTFRCNEKEIWHEEDEYTAGMALLLSELCQTSVIATIWRTEESDPNEHDEMRSAYKRALRHLVKRSNSSATWLLDLHGASEDSKFMAITQKVDLGRGNDSKKYYLPADAYQMLVSFIENGLGKGNVDRVKKSGFPAGDEGRIAAFAHNELGLSSIQIEMKPSVRIPMRRIDSSTYGKVSLNPVDQKDIIAMLQALVNFIEYLKNTTR
jgi:hypothetical protein